MTATRLFPVTKHWVNKGIRSAVHSESYFSTQTCLVSTSNAFAQTSADSQQYAIMLVLVHGHVW